jgi:hypothetical protein
MSRPAEPHSSMSRPGGSSSKVEPEGLVRPSSTVTSRLEPDESKQ